MKTKFVVKYKVTWRDEPIVVECETFEEALAELLAEMSDTNSKKITLTMKRSK